MTPAVRQIIFSLPLSLHLHPHQDMLPVHAAARAIHISATTQRSRKPFGLKFESDPLSSDPVDWTADNPGYAHRGARIIGRDSGSRPERPRPPRYEANTRELEDTPRQNRRHSWDRDRRGDQHMAGIYTSRQHGDVEPMTMAWEADSKVSEPPRQHGMAGRHASWRQGDSQRMDRGWTPDADSGFRYSLAHRIKSTQRDSRQNTGGVTKYQVWRTRENGGGRDGFRQQMEDPEAYQLEGSSKGEETQDRGAEPPSAQEQTRNHGAGQATASSLHPSDHDGAQSIPRLRSTSGGPAVRAGSLSAAWRAGDNISSPPPPSPVSWAPTKKLTFAAMDGLRALHQSDPKLYNRAALGEKFGISYDAVGRILRSRYKHEEGKERQEETRWRKSERAEELSPVAAIQRVVAQRDGATWRM